MALRYFLRRRLLGLGVVSSVRTGKRRDPTPVRSFREMCPRTQPKPRRRRSMASRVAGGEVSTDRVGSEECILHVGDAEREGLVVRAFARSDGALGNLPRLLGR